MIFTTDKQAKARRRTANSRENGEQYESISCYGEAQQETDCILGRTTLPSSHDLPPANSPAVSASLSDPTSGSKQSGSAPSVLADVRAKRTNRRRKAPPEWFQSLVTRWQNSESIRPQLHELLRTYRHELISYSASALALCLLAFLLAAWVLPAEDRNFLFDLLATQSEPELTELGTVEFEPVFDQQQAQSSPTNQAIAQLESIEDIADISEPKVDAFDDLQIQLRPTLSDLKELAKVGDFGGRSAKGRQIAVAEYGGSAASEQAVLYGLKWLAKIQRKDGGWDFQKQGPEAEIGRYVRSRNAATSLALLCFLGAGHTHVEDGLYQKNVDQALRFLVKNSSIQAGSADMRGDYEGNSGMYTHALATICLTEASALSPKDKELAKLAAAAVRFIERSQVTGEGSWGYKTDSDSGDTSVVGWMVVALYSGRSSGIRISSRTLRSARNYLRDVATDSSQAFYSYKPGQSRKPSTTAIGLLCRMYMGWGPDMDAIQKGVGYLSSVGPSKDNMYYNYYASQVLRHYGGDEWTKWNSVMREQLINRQVRKGPTKGSWKPQGAHHELGGQLYETALCVLTLEIYYRHLPLYQQLKPADDDAINAGKLSGE